MFILVGEVGVWEDWSVRSGAILCWVLVIFGCWWRGLGEGRRKEEEEEEGGSGSFRGSALATLSLERLALAHLQQHLHTVALARAVVAERAEGVPHGAGHDGVDEALPRGGEAVGWWGEKGGREGWWMLD